MAEPAQNALRILLKRGTKEQNDQYIGEEGEITIVVENFIEDTEFKNEPEQFIAPLGAFEAPNGNTI